MLPVASGTRRRPGQGSGKTSFARSLVWCVGAVALCCSVTFIAMARERGAQGRTGEERPTVLVKEAQSAGTANYTNSAKDVQSSHPPTTVRNSWDESEQTRTRSGAIVFLTFGNTNGRHNNQLKAIMNALYLSAEINVRLRRRGATAASEAAPPQVIPVIPPFSQNRKWTPFENLYEFVGLNLSAPSAGREEDQFPAGYATEAEALAFMEKSGGSRSSTKRWLQAVTRSRCPETTRRSVSVTCFPRRGIPSRIPRRSQLRLLKTVGQSQMGASLDDYGEDADHTICDSSSDLGSSRDPTAVVSKLYAAVIREWRKKPATTSSAALTAARMNDTCGENSTSPSGGLQCSTETTFTGVPLLILYLYEAIYYDRISGSNDALANIWSAFRPSHAVSERVDQVYKWRNIRFFDIAVHRRSLEGSCIDRMEKHYKRWWWALSDDLSGQRIRKRPIAPLWQCHMDESSIRREVRLQRPMLPQGNLSSSSSTETDKHSSQPASPSVPPMYIAHDGQDAKGVYEISRVFHAYTTTDVQHEARVRGDTALAADGSLVGLAVDYWICVDAPIFIGNEMSSMSTNIALKRMALGKLVHGRYKLPDHSPSRLA